MIGFDTEIFFIRTVNGNAGGIENAHSRVAGQVQEQIQEYRIIQRDKIRFQYYEIRRLAFQ